MAQSINGPESMPNSDSTPDKVVVISSDSEGSDMECTHNSYVTEIIMKKEKSSDDPVLEEAVVSDATVTDKSEGPEEQEIATGNCVEHLGCTRNSDATEIVMKKISDDHPLEDSAVSDVNDSDLLKNQEIATCSSVEPQRSDVECTPNSYVAKIDTKKTAISEDLPLEVAVVSDLAVVDHSELLKEEGQDDCVESHKSDVECPRNSYVAEINTKMTAISGDLQLGVTIVDHSESLKEQGQGNCVELQKSDVEYTLNSYATGIDANDMDTSDEPLLETAAVSDVTATDHTELLGVQELVTISCDKTHQPTTSPLKVLSAANTTLMEMHQNLNSLCSYDTDSIQPIIDSNSPAQENISLSADQSNDNSQAEEDNSCDSGPTETVIDDLGESKRNIWSECNTSYVVSQGIEHNSTNNQSTDGTGQSKLKDNLCECSSCSKSENVISSVDDDTTEVFIDRIRQLKPKCLQFERECESEPNDPIEQLIERKGPSTPAPDKPVTDITQTSMNDANSTRSDFEDSPAQRLVWSSDHEVQSNGDIADESSIDSFRNSNDSESIKEEQNGGSDDCFMICKDEYVVHSTNDDSDQISNDEKNQNKSDTEKTDVLNCSDDELLDKLDQRTDQKYLENRSMSDDELIKSGRYGVGVKNEAVDLQTSFCGVTLGKLNSMDGRMMLRANVVAVPDLKNEKPPVVDHKSKLSESSKSQDDASSAEQSIGYTEFELEYGQRPPEKDDKLLIRLKRKQAAAKLTNLAEIAAKRKRIETSTASTESDADTDTIQSSKRTHRQPRKSSHKVIERMGGFFRKLSQNLRDKRKKMKAKLSRKRKSFTQIQETTDHTFVVTPYREDKVVESMKGFVIVPDRR